MPFDTVIPGGRKISKKSKPVVKSHTTWALLNVIFVSSRIKADIYVCNVNELSLRLAAPWLVMSLFGQGQARGIWTYHLKKAQYHEGPLFLRLHCGQTSEHT